MLEKGAEEGREGRRGKSADDRRLNQHLQSQAWILLSGTAAGYAFQDRIFKPQQVLQLHIPLSPETDGIQKRQSMKKKGPKVFSSMQGVLNWARPDRRRKKLFIQECLLRRLYA